MPEDTKKLRESLSKSLEKTKSAPKKKKKPAKTAKKARPKRVTPRSIGESKHVDPLFQVVSGRPNAFQSVEEVEARVNEYFNRLIGEDPKNKGKFGFIEHPTISGLCLYLGVSRSTLFEYEKRNDEFANVIKKAKMVIQSYLEGRLYDGYGQKTGLIFSFKNNFGWKDERSVDLRTFDVNDFLNELHGRSGDESGDSEIEALLDE